MLNWLICKYQFPKEVRTVATPALVYKTLLSNLLYVKEQREKLFDLKIIHESNLFSLFFYIHIYFFQWCQRKLQFSPLWTFDPFPIEVNKLFICSQPSYTSSTTVTPTKNVIDSWGNHCWFSVFYWLLAMEKDSSAKFSYEVFLIFIVKLFITFMLRWGMTGPG